MKSIKRQLDLVMDGFFNFYGFSQNPAEQAAKTMMKESPADKIRADLRRINKDYRKSFEAMRKENYCIEQ